jgi:hypothetical protein
MAYQTFRVSQDDMSNYYLPQSYRYEKMITSINENGYGQLIYNYKGPGDFSLNSFNEWDSSLRRMVVRTADESATYTESQAGPALWGVSSEVGISFLRGDVSISGLVKLKYCNTCEDGNGLPPETITSFSNRFSYLKELKNNYGADTGYIFYDYSLPPSQRWYPSVYDTGLGRYVFKNYLGVNKLEAQVSSETSIPLQDITASIDSAEPIKPPTITSSVIVNCCDGSTTYVIDGIYDPGATIFTPDVKPYQCYQVTKNTSDRADNFYTWEKFGGKCTDCTTTYGSCKRR